MKKKYLKKSFDSWDTMQIFSYPYFPKHCCDLAEIWNLIVFSLENIFQNSGILNFLRESSLRGSHLYGNIILNTKTFEKRFEKSSRKKFWKCLLTKGSKKKLWKKFLKNFFRLSLMPNIWQNFVFSQNFQFSKIEISILPNFQAKMQKLKEKCLTSEVFQKG